MHIFYHLRNSTWGERLSTREIPSLFNLWALVTAVFRDYSISSIMTNLLAVVKYHFLCFLLAILCVLFSALRHGLLIHSFNCSLSLFFPLFIYLFILKKEKYIHIYMYFLVLNFNSLLKYRRMWNFAVPNHYYNPAIFSTWSNNSPHHLLQYSPIEYPPVLP